MNEAYSEDIREWIQDLTTVQWGESPPTHCMSDRYQRIDSRAAPMPIPGIPAFQTSPSPLQEEETTENQGSEFNNGQARSRITELVLQTRNYFQGFVEEGSKDIRALREEVDSLRSDVEDISSYIDSRFKVTRNIREEKIEENKKTVEKFPALRHYLVTSEEVETNMVLETNIVAETIRLKKILSIKSGFEEKEVESVLGDDADISEEFWHIEPDRSPSASEVAENPRLDGHDLLHPLAIPEPRLCIDLSTAGFDVGLDFFPAEAAVAQAVTYLRFYLADLREAANKYGNTHALLHFRLIIAEMVRREYELHGEVDDWTKEEVVRWVNRDFSGSNLKDPQALLSSVEDILADPGETDRAWRKEGGSCVPNASGLHDILVRENKDVLKRESDAHEVDEITKQTLRKYVDLISELKLEELRREAGLSSDK